MKSKSIILSSLSIIFIVACATIGKHVSKNMTSIPVDKGLVLFSTGSSKTSIANSTNFFLVDGSSKKWYTKAEIRIDYPNASDIPNEHTNIRTLLLPEGDYFLVPKALNPTYYYKDAPVYKFTVKKNQATYIGNFWLYDSGLKWTVKNFDRDKEFFLKNNPGMINCTIEPQVIEVASNVAMFEIKGQITTLP